MVVAVVKIRCQANVAIKITARALCIVISCLGGSFADPWLHKNSGYYIPLTGYLLLPKFVGFQLELYCFKYQLISRHLAGSSGAGFPRHVVAVDSRLFSLSTQQLFYGQGLPFFVLSTY
jgi:hypothetical protein